MCISASLQKKKYLQKLFQNTVTEWQKSISNDKIP